MRKLHFSIVAIVVLWGMPMFADQTKLVAEGSNDVRAKIDFNSPQGCSHIYGFNYQPSWGSNGLSVWGELFDAEKYRQELDTGKKYFPKFNTVRIWLSWNAYRKNPPEFIRHFREAMDICGKLDLLVMPVLFNRWTQVATGQLQWDVVEDAEIAANFDTTFAPFIKDVLEATKGDKHILAFDLCNEPSLKAKPYELGWIASICQAVKLANPQALTCIGTLNPRHMEVLAPYSDILTPHLYSKFGMLQQIDSFVQIATKVKKPLISTECCWGSLNDKARSWIVISDLAVMKMYGIGFLPHALYESGVADLHRPQYGPVGGAEYMAFIYMDGSLRAGHEVYNLVTK